jgi:23S rRNA pseudouridine1911/1915/1917 synthase
MIENQAHFTTGIDAAGKRLDRYLTTCFPQISGQKWKTYIQAGLVLVNNRSASKSQIIETSWQIDVSAALACAAILPAPNSSLALDLEILLQDEALIICNKPAGLPCHPITADETKTVFQALLAIDPAIGQAGPKSLEGGLVHRLDVDTSGILVAARNPASFVATQSIFAHHLAQKTYLGLTVGQIPHDTIRDFPIAHHAKNARRMVAIDPQNQPTSGTWRGKPRPARTEIKILQQLRGASLVQITVFQAQMHQIRVHLAAIGHPLLGDAVYLADQPAPETGLSRHALHAWKLDMPHPTSGELLSIEAPLPLDFQTAIARLTTGY